MAQTIIIKNSVKTTPPTLLTGELALTTAKDLERLWIKNTSGDTINIAVTKEQKDVLDRLSIVNNKLQISGDTYSTGELSAYGAGSGTGGSGGGLIATVYASTDLGGTFSNSNYNDTFNAYTINTINNDVISAKSRISTLEGGSATSISLTGTGNVITSLSKSGTIITANKGVTAIIEGDSRLTDNRKNPYALTFSGYSTLTYDGGAAVTIPIPNKLSQLTNDSGYLTSITKAQVEGVLTGAITTHTHSYLPLAGGTVGALTITGNLVVNGGTTTINSTTMTLDDPVIVLGGDTMPTVNDGIDRGVQFNYHNGTTGKTGFFGFDASTGYFTFIKEATNASEVFSGTAGDIAATNFRGNLVGNADSATILYTTRTIWGQSFNGSANVSGSMTGVSTITASGTITAPTFSGALSGNASTATKLATARTFTIAATGCSSTGGTFDGSGNCSIAFAINTIDGGTW